ncbi:MAG: hypothetical protein NPIRA02_22600 [Nitrospirales bacterium]|nr:MAG: hypothetical protein NPIRA02_22600 [Nitrospirales bacterium]
MTELMVPGHITTLKTLDPGEVRIIELTLPQQWEIEGNMYPIHDTMRPGTAFLAKPWGSRTEKRRRRMYTRSNSSMHSAYCLETIINYTHTEKSDTSAWWQTDECVEWQQFGQPLEVKVEWNHDRTALHIYENSQTCLDSNLRLEPDGEWERMHFLALAFSTGITPFLSYLRYMKGLNFGRSTSHAGARFGLIVSVRSPEQLMAHDELLVLQQHFPDNFWYHPVLTRRWPEDWPFTRGRIMRTRQATVDDTAIDLSQLLAIVPDLQQYHIRYCGNKAALTQLRQGFQEQGVRLHSIRAEVW